MRETLQYKSETKPAMLGSRVITLEHLTPILSPKEHAETKREIEKHLYEIFVKYEKHTSKQRQAAI